jgi:hypothetical protein
MLTAKRTREQIKDETECFTVVYSPAAADLRKILGQVGRLKRAIDSWLGGHHDRCRCCFCSHDETAPNVIEAGSADIIRRDLTGFLWAIRSIDGTLDAIIPMCCPEDAEILPLVSRRMIDAGLIVPPSPRRRPRSPVNRTA